tara:strand:+ start:301 stop:825 length:525 start_codon:yes stop_codon:yes gene_type:complete
MLSSGAIDVPPADEIVVLPVPKLSKLSVEPLCPVRLSAELSKLGVGTPPVRTSVVQGAEPRVCQSQKSPRFSAFRMVSNGFQKHGKSFAVVIEGDQGQSQMKGVVGLQPARCSKVVGCLGVVVYRKFNHAQHGMSADVSRRMSDDVTAQFLRCAAPFIANVKLRGSKETVDRRR